MKSLLYGLTCGLLCLLLMIWGVTAQGAGWRRVRFVVVDAVTGKPLAGAKVTLEDATGLHQARTLTAGLYLPGPTHAFDLREWQTADTVNTTEPPKVITVVEGAHVILQVQTAPPVKDIYVKVTAARLPPRSNPTATGTTIDRAKIEQKTGVGGNITDLLKGNNGVASDSAGQQHVRGEHAEIAYVVDGVPLPDTLSGRQGSIVVPATIQSLEFLTGGYAPEFGGQTAAILNISTRPGAARSQTDLGVEGGSYDTFNGDVTTLGPLGKYASYVLDFNATRSRNAVEPQQPDDQTAHNAGSSLSYFTKLRYTPGKRDTLTLTLSRSPDTLQISNRTGLPASFALAGQGFGFLGQRNADGTRPDTTLSNPDGLGAQTLLLPSQQVDGQDITQREVSEFATLSWRRQLSRRETGLLAVTLLHSGQDVHNHNPLVDVLNLPVDNSIEYNPTAIRNIHHVQLTGSLSSQQGRHAFKAGFLLDDQNGSEAYQIIPVSRLALDALAALSPNLAPAGTILMDAQGNPILDVNGNPIYAPSSGTSPTLQVHRSGFYRAAYLQDTWKASRQFTLNYGLRADWYKQTQNLGQATISTIVLSPRFNFSYAFNPRTTARWSYNRLFNTPPLAQGAVVGQPIEPEVLDQYDVSLEHLVAPGQTLRMAYYVKQIHNQVDTGLLIPGSQIGLYSALNLQFGGVHGFEFSYDFGPPKPKGYGWDANVNYTYSAARPNGVDNTGAQVPEFNDHDQRITIGFEAAYTWKSGAVASLTLNHGSGLASSPIPPSDKRIPRTQVDLRFNTSPKFLRGHGGLGLSIENLFDDRTVINFQSAFSGTRFQQGRRVLFSLSGSF